MGQEAEDRAMTRPKRIALLGNPNTGKTTLFNRLCGLRHKTSNFPGTTQEARVGFVRDPEIELIDLPGIYSLELEQSEAGVCREVLEGRLAPQGEEVSAPDAVCVVVDGTNLARNLVLAGEALRRRLPTVVCVTMNDLARRRGLHVDVAVLAAKLGCVVVAVNGRSGEGVDVLASRLAHAEIPNQTPPGTRAGLEAWADDVALAVTSTPEGASRAFSDHGVLTDKLDRVLTHALLGPLAFALVMAGLFWSIFSLAEFPMGWIETLFAWLSSIVERAVPEGILREFLAQGVVAGVGATLVFLPQICLLFFLISLLEDTGYLARAAFVMDRVLRPFGLPGHSFVPLLSSHACALPGIMACRAIPDRRERLATILVAPFMTCSARLPVYVLVTSVLFPREPGKAALAFLGCYALGMIAGVLSALVARRTILRGQSRPMALELPTYKLPSVRTAILTTIDRALTFLKNAGTNILAISIVLWWLGAYPKVDPPAQAVAIRAQGGDLAEADRLEAAHAKASSFIGRLGKAAEPAFAPLGYDWKLTVGVLSSFAAREVFVSTMAVITTGSMDAEDQGVLDAVVNARRDEGGRLFTPAVAWSILVFYALAMQCLPTLAVTARESGHVKWALLQLAWMSAVAYAAAWLAFRLAGGHA
jgi:ferrous iron transport protein B